MREIKFRAWDEEDKLMLQPEDICHLDGETSKELGFSSPFWVLEQFTGLHDKNGKEIYENSKAKTPDYTIGIVKYGEYQPQLGTNLYNFKGNIKSCVNRYCGSIRCSLSQSLSDQLYGWLSQIYTSICFGWYVETENGHYGLNEKNEKGFEIIGTIHDEVTP